MAGKSFAVSRYDRGLDRDFGVRGVALTDFLRREEERPAAVVVDGRDRPVVGGTVSFGRSTAIGVARYTPGGRLDATRGTVRPLAGAERLDDVVAGFGGNGRVVLGFRGLADCELAGLAVDRHDRVLLAGSGRADPDEGRVFALARLRVDGAVDEAFGDGGHVVTDFLRFEREYPTGASLDAEGRIVVAGRAQDDDGVVRAAVARYTDGGVPDTQFHANGRALYRFGAGAGAGSDLVADVATDGDSRIVLVGGLGGQRWGVARIAPDGTRDATFGGGLPPTPSFAGTPVDPASADARVIAVMPDDRVVVAGVGRHPSDASNRFWLVVRYLPDGSLDTSLGGSGWVAYDVPNGVWEVPDAVAVDAAERIVLAGRAERHDWWRPVVARLFPDGSRDRSLDGRSDGRADGMIAAPTLLASRRSHRASVAVDGRDRIVVAGAFERRMGAVSGDSMTGFLPSLHGWRFENQVIPRALLDVGGVVGAEGLVEVMANMTYCGGMALAAKDHFAFHRSVPDMAEPPATGSPTADYIMERQLASLGKRRLLEPFHPLGPWGRRFRRWFARAERTPEGPANDALYADLATANQQLYAASEDEVRQIVRMLDDGDTVMVGLIYDDARHLWDNHQVLAYHYERAGRGPTAGVSLYVYDPNYPAENDLRLELTFTEIAFQLVGGGGAWRVAVVNTAAKFRGGERLKVLRGLFQMQRGEGSRRDVRATEPPELMLTVAT